MVQQIKKIANKFNDERFLVELPGKVAIGALAFVILLTIYYGK
jgi:hypothetical protein